MSNEAEDLKPQPQTGIARRSRTRRQSSDQAPISHEKILQRQDDAYFWLLETNEVKGALFALTRAQEVRDSVSRKLCGGSHAVTVDLLASWENKLAESKAVVLNLLNKHPELARHPTVAAVAAALPNSQGKL